MGYLAKSDNLFMETLAKAIAGDKVAGLQCRMAIQAFHNKPRQVMRAAIQAFQKQVQATGVATDFAKLISDAYSVTIATDNFDLGYERAFKTVPLGIDQDTWDIYSVSNGLTFNLIPEGGRIKIDELSGTVVTCRVNYFGGALGWTDAMIRFRKVAAMLDMASIFRNKFWVNKADNHYILLAVAGAMHVTAYQGASGDGVLRRDIQTLNKAAFTLANRNKDKGYGDMANPQLLLFANPLDKARINGALAANTQFLQAALGRGESIEWNISPIWTFNKNIVAGYPLLVLAGNKLQAAEALPPTTFTAPKDPLTLNEVQAVWSIYGAVVGDDEQIETVSLQ